eukprot:1172283-Rhodomonas_salina.1
MFATCKSAGCYGETNHCCTMVQSLWELYDNLVPLQQKHQVKPKVYIWDNQDIKPCVFTVPESCPAAYITRPEFVDRLGLDRTADKHSLYPSTNMDQPPIWTVDRTATVWGPWRARTVVLHKEIGSGGIVKH